jgi:glycerol-3-phosphate acyltransferase PlsY
MNIPLVIAIVAVGYLLGSIPIAYIVMRLYDGRDLRLVGTGNLTSTAVMVHAGRVPGTISLLGEIFKTFLCLYIVYLLDAGLWAYLLMLVSAALGQIWSVWLKGAGGRGQTVFVTGFLVLCPIPFLFAGLSYLLTLRITGRSYFANQLFHVVTPFTLMLANLFNPAILGLGEHSWGYSIVGAIFCGLFFYKQRRENDDIVRSQAWGTYSR